MARELSKTSQSLWAGSEATNRTSFVNENLVINSTAREALADDRVVLISARAARAALAPPVIPNTEPALKAWKLVTNGQQVSSNRVVLSEKDSGQRKTTHS